MGKLGKFELLLVILPIAILVITYMLGYRSGRVRGERDTLKRIQDSKNNS
jgi:hypothetical protein